MDTVKNLARAHAGPIGWGIHARRLLATASVRPMQAALNKLMCAYAIVKNGLAITAPFPDVTVV